MSKSAAGRSMGAYESGLYPILDISDSYRRGYTPHMSLLTDLDAFTREHMRCGELDGGVDEIAPGEWRV